jgi:hypothetical protein
LKKKRLRPQPVLQQFAFKRGGALGGWHGQVQLAKRELRGLTVSAGWVAYGPEDGRGLPQRFSYKATVTPPAERWRQFRQILDELDVWQWESEPFSMLDAGFFELTLADETRAHRWRGHSHLRIVELVRANEDLIDLPLTSPAERGLADRRDARLL